VTSGTLPAVPGRPPRDTRLDILRGWLQLTIFVSHAGTTWLYGWLVYGAWGLSDSSEQFVFLSGYVLGSVFARKMAIQSWAAAVTDILLRAWRLYRKHLVVFLLFGTIIIGVDRAGWMPGEIDRLGWTLVVHDPLQAGPAALAMLHLPKFMDILPLFVWCMLMLPAFAMLEARFGARALLMPFALYAGVWLFGLRLPDAGGESVTGFNPLAWQLLFLLGAWLGRRALLFGQPLPPSRGATALALLIVVAGVALKLDWSEVPAWVADLRIFDKRDLGLPVIAHAMALAWLASCILPRYARWMEQLPLRWLAAAGRQSLNVFCAGLFLSWATNTSLRLYPVWWLELLMIPAGMVTLLIYGWYAERQSIRGSIGARDTVNTAALPAAKALPS
jgi:hypothetical protein